MSQPPAVRCVLMSVHTVDTPNGFNQLVFRVSANRTSIETVTVLISNDAWRKLSAQLLRARVPKMERDQMLRRWARWEIEAHAEMGPLPSTLTITASDLDEYGAYALDFGRTLMAG